MTQGRVTLLNTQRWELMANPISVGVFILILNVFVLPHHNVQARVEPLSKKTFEGDIDMTRREMKSMQTEILFSDKVHPINTWKNGEIPYQISSKFNAAQQEEIRQAMKDITGDTCIQFIPHPPNKNEDFIDFVFSKEIRCSSKVGRVGGRQEVLINPSCLKLGTVVHELLHALGLFHEQSRLDRDNYINVLWKNVKNPENRRNFEKYGTKFDEENKLPYDYSSIMHYSSEAFSKKYGLKTLVPKTPDAPIGQRSSMSHFDKVKINLLYKCPDVE